MLIRRIIIAFFAAILSLAVTIPARAGITTTIMELDISTYGTFPVQVNNPDNPALSAKFEDVSLGTVNLTLDATNLVVGQYVVTWLFNTKDIDARALTITPVGPNNAEASGIDTSLANTFIGHESLNAGKFNIKFNFPNNTTEPSQRLAGGESQKYQITYQIPGTTLTSANFLSLSTEANGGKYTAARLMGIPSRPGNTTHGGIAGTTVTAVPEPGAMIYSSLGLLGLAALRLRRRRAA